MIALMLILGVLAVLLLVISVFQYLTDYEGGIALFFAILFGTPAVILLMLTANAKWSAETLTGFVYSKDSKWGVTNYHIRFSETAGEDVQPSFCATTGTQNAKEIDAVVGTGKKVTIEVPSKGLYFTNDLWHCASDAKLVKE